MLRQVWVFNRKPWKELGRKFNYKLCTCISRHGAGVISEQLLGKKTRPINFKIPCSKYKPIKQINLAQILLSWMKSKTRKQ